MHRMTDASFHKALLWGLTLLLRWVPQKTQLVQLRRTRSAGACSAAVRRCCISACAHSLLSSIHLTAVHGLTATKGRRRAYEMHALGVEGDAYALHTCPCAGARTVLR